MGRSPNMDGAIIALFKQIAGQIKQIRSICLWIILLDVLVITWLTITMIGKLVVHISGLKDRMQRFALDNTKVPETDYDYSSRKDEIGTLNRQFDEMSRTIIDLIQENYVNDNVGREMEIVSSYVTIQKFRYEERLIFENCIEQEWDSVEIPKLVIQPLLENAIFYGLERNVEDCEIILSGEREGHMLKLVIANAGNSLYRKVRTEV